MSKWTHSICDKCWEAKHPGRKAVRITSRETIDTLGLPVDKCCFCHAEHTSGIYVRGQPELTPCRGEHTNEASGAGTEDC